MDRQPGNHRLAKIQKRRSLSLSRGRNRRRRRTNSRCRKHTFSATNDALDLQQAAIAHPHPGHDAGCSFDEPQIVKPLWDCSRFRRESRDGTGCPYRISIPDVLVVQSTENWPRYNPANALHGRWNRRVLAKRHVRSGLTGSMSPKRGLFGAVRFRTLIFRRKTRFSALSALSIGPGQRTPRGQQVGRGPAGPARRSRQSYGIPRPCCVKLHHAAGRKPRSSAG
jgi:hypothetical protein